MISYWLNVLESVRSGRRTCWKPESVEYVGQESALLCVGNVSAAIRAAPRWTPGGQRQPGSDWMRSVCAVSSGSQRGLSPLPPPQRHSVGAFVCGPSSLRTLWPFTCDCVQSRGAPSSSGSGASVSFSNQRLTR